MTIQQKPELAQTQRSRSAPGRFVIALPEPSIEIAQDQEWCLVRLEDKWQEIRFHNYANVYDIAGLYEQLFYKTLGCTSPTTIRDLLDRHLDRAGVEPSELRVLDLGAGNGMVGEELRRLGVETVVGVDIVEAAERATRRDRPHVYSDYLVADITQLNQAQRELMEGYQFNAMTCVAALGFGDIPTDAFLAAFNLVEPGGWIAFNIKDNFLDDDRCDFARLIRAMDLRGDLDIREQIRYVHRYGTNGDPLHYYAIVGIKQRDVTGSA